MRCTTRRLGPPSTRTLITFPAVPIFADVFVYSSLSRFLIFSIYMPIAAYNALGPVSFFLTQLLFCQLSIVIHPYLISHNNSVGPLRT
ncbi:hypothetical protein F5146DRAFT_1077122 [Armillaria mellea]|nr:hypothetical protein F5146DRAFT_1077122 [Armillaria mellea]